MENLLRLPDGALAKEIQLSQDLMQLFIDYQVVVCVCICVCSVAEDEMIMKYTWLESEP